MKKILGFIFLSFAAVFSNAQSAKLPSVIPPAPNTTALGKFVDLPVGLYNGIPQINIPLYTIQLGSVNLPISLSYHASGIKVGELSPNVGLGWALNAGGAITRSVQGLNDERGWFIAQKYPPPLNPNCLTGSSNPTVQDVITNIHNGVYDTEPDIFYFNFNGISGKFVFDKNGVIQTIPQNKIKIEQFGSLNNWKITTEDGAIYKFAEMEFTTSSGSSTFNNPTYPSAWYLTEISLPYSTQKITFTYTRPIYCYTNPIAEMNDEGGAGPSTIIGSCCVTAPVISEIVFPNGKIVFTEGNYRYDISGAKVMDRVTIRNNDGDLKSFKLTYKYLDQGGSLIADDGLATSTTPESTAKRLFLTSVAENDKGNIQSNPPYEFEYYSGMLPDRINSKALDFWGYYNGHNENSTLIPPHLSQFFGQFIDGGDRIPVEQYAKIGALMKIKYPTGGYTQFDFEQNSATLSSYPTNNVAISANYMIGGCHVYGSTDFTLNDNQTGSTQIKVSLSGQLNNYTAVTCTGGPGAPIPVISNASTFIYFEIVNITNPASPVVVVDHDMRFSIPRTGSNTSFVTLPNGTYRIIAVRGGGTTPLTDVDVNFNYPAMINITGNYFRTDIANKIGGLRIKKMTFYDPIAAKSIIKTYDYTENGYSSGRTSGAAVFNHSGDEICIGTAESEIWTGYVQSPMSLQQSSPAGYSKVTVYNEEIQGSVSSSGKTEYYYTNPVDVFPIGVDPNSPPGSLNLCYTENNGPDFSRYPFAPAISSDWNRGLLTSQIDYKTNTQQTDYVKVRAIVNTYKDDYFGQPDIRFNNNTTDVKAMRIGYVHYCASEAYYPPPKIKRMIVQYYFIPVRTQKLIKTEEYTYDPSGANPIVQKQEFSYDNLAHMQLTKSVFYKSAGNTITTHNLYPLDYNNTTGFIGDMKNANIINKPIESVSYLTDVSTGSIKILKGSLSSYKQSPNIGLPDNLRTISTVSPIPLAQFRFSNQSSAGVLPQPGTFSSYSPDGSYSTLADLLYNYDDRGNITSVSKESDVKNSFVWGYNKSYPIAKVVNAESKDIFYTSFEEGDGNSSAGDSKTGNKSKTNGFSQSLSNLTNGNYILSYWQKSGSAWILQKSTVIVSSGSYTISLAGQVDEVRFYPEKAMMTTLTYTPGVGMSSQCDVNNRVNYYEYDNFQRLIIIRDQDNNIVKKICYNYAGQAENCTLPTFSNVSKSGTFTRSDCSSGTGSNVTYTVPAGTYTSFLSQPDADQKAQDDVNNNGQAYANANGVCIVSCSFSMSSGFIGTTATISGTNNNVSFNLIFFSNSTMILGTEYMVATISSGCRPLTDKTMTLFYAGRSFFVTIHAITGLMGVRPISGSNIPATSSITLSGGYDKSY